MPLIGQWTSDPVVLLLLTTATSYGLYGFNADTQRLIAFDMEQVLVEQESFVMREVPQGVTIIDSGFPQDFGRGFLDGGVMGIGALGSSDYRFGYVYSEPQ